MKYKRKLAPATTFDFAAMETWLSDMAEDGWIPVDFRGEKVKFQQAEPQKRSYRIAIPRYFDTQPTAKRWRHTVSLVGNYLYLPLQGLSSGEYHGASPRALHRPCRTEEKH